MMPQFYPALESSDDVVSGVTRIRMDVWLDTFHAAIAQIDFTIGEDNLESYMATCGEIADGCLEHFDEAFPAYDEDTEDVLCDCAACTTTPATSPGGNSVSSPGLTPGDLTTVVPFNVTDMVSHVGRDRQRKLGAITKVDFDEPNARWRYQLNHVGYWFRHSELSPAPVESDP